jgi:hypothetical protein
VLLSRFRGFLLLAICIAHFEPQFRGYRVDGFLFGL